jgi:hypothetical protein
MVSIDGAELGEATVDQDGNWAVPATTPLIEGPHIARAVQTNPDGNESTTRSNSPSTPWRRMLR